MPRHSWKGNTSIGLDAWRCDNHHLRNSYRLLHAIHDFLPRHQAGSEIYALELCRELAKTHHVTVLCASYDPSLPHGHVVWRLHEGLPVVEIVNNWACRNFADTYRPPLITERIRQVFHAVQPEVVHIHNLLNLSFDLPAVAQNTGVPVVATLHDYTLVCASGGQRIHKAEAHVCHDIDTARCVRCFKESAFFAQASFGAMSNGHAGGTLTRIARAVARRMPALATGMARAAARSRLPVAREDLDGRLAAARQVFDAVDLFVAPAPSLAREFRHLGIDPRKIRVSDYGFVPLPAMRRQLRRDDGRSPLRLGFVGTLVWHKGAHVLIDALRSLPTGGYELRIFGNPEVFPAYSASLRKDARGLPITFMGAFERSRTAEVYADIDVLVVPSLWLENSPLVIHEAFMAGIPVVGARTGGIADLIEDGINGLLYDPRSSADLARALANLIENRALLARLSDGTRSVPRVKSIDDDAREWNERYADAVQQRQAAGARA